jgi:hypothetical protein
VELENKGIPVATICTEEFVTLGVNAAQSSGMPDLPIVTVPHPVGGIKAQEVRQKADMVVDKIIEVLTST